MSLNATASVVAAAGAVSVSPMLKRLQGIGEDRLPLLLAAARYARRWSDPRSSRALDHSETIAGKGIATT